MLDNSKSVKVSVPVSRTAPAGIIGVTIGELRNMKFDEIRAMRPQMRGVRKQKFYDTLVVNPAEVIEQGTQHALFRKGINESDYFFGQKGVAAAEYNKSYLHTNMLRGGEFPSNTAFLVESIEAPCKMTSGTKAGIVAGIITDPAITAQANYDPAVVQDAWLGQNRLTFMRNESKLHNGLLEQFSSREAISGAYGASPGGFVQNAPFDEDLNVLEDPEILVGGEDFQFVIDAEAPTFSLVAVNTWIRQRIVLRGLYLYELYG